MVALLQCEASLPDVEQQNADAARCRCVERLSLPACIQIIGDEQAAAQGDDGQALPFTLAEAVSQALRQLRLGRGQVHNRERLPARGGKLVRGNPGQILPMTAAVVGAPGHAAETRSGRPTWAKLVSTVLSSSTGLFTVRIW